MLEPMGYGDGTITRRRDGRLQVMVSVGGRRRYAMIPARLPPKEQRKKAEDKRRELLALRDAELEPSSQTLAVYLRSWIASLRDAKRKRVRPRTLDHYEMIVERHIIPALGHHRLDALRERHVQRWLDADTGSARTIHHHRAVLRRALNVAVRQRILARNPALAVELPEPDDFAGDPLSIDEALRLLDVTAKDRLHALWRLAIVTGLRQGELLGLSRDDVDGRTLRVGGQLQRLDGSWVLGKTKAARALGTLTLDEDTAAIVEAHKRRMADERTPDWPYFGLLFVTTTGRPYHQAEVLKAFHRACDRAGVRRRRFHDLRVTNATFMRQLGIAEDLRMARMGHETKEMARHYARAQAGIDREAADALGAALRGAV